LPGSWVGSDSQSDFNAIRENAPAGYTIFRYGGAMSHYFDSGWQAGVAVNGQYSGDPLAPGEQFGIGGTDSVRGLFARQYANDNGIAGSAEIYTPNLSKFMSLAEADSRFLLFADAGHLSRNQPLPGEASRMTLASVGGGVRFLYRKHYSFSMDYGTLVKPDGDRSRWDRRVHFSMRIMY
jgi:hemolysin activation/secretion protein